MTPEQITQLLNIAGSLPTQAFLALGLYFLWKAFSNFIDRVFTLIEQWSALAMKVVENASQPRPTVFLPAKIPESQGNPPAPG